jgi:hypothetical protein
MDEADPRDSVLGRGSGLLEPLSYARGDLLDEPTLEALGIRGDELERYVENEARDSASVSLLYSEHLL